MEEMRHARGEFSSLARYQAAAIQGRGLFENLVRANAMEQLPRDVLLYPLLVCVSKLLMRKLIVGVKMTSNI